MTFWNDIAGQYVGLMQRWADTFQQRTGVKIEVTGGVGDYEAKLLDTRFWTGQETAAQVAKQIKDQGAAFLKA